MLPLCLKVLVQRLCTDMTACQAFLTNPDKVLDGIPVSTEERRALLRLHARLTTAGSANGAAALAVGALSPWP